MSESRKEHNREELEEWLRQYRDRFPSGPQEMLRVENRKMESKAPVKGANYLRLDHPGYHNSDQILLAILVWLAEYFPTSFAALNAPYLNPDTSVSEIDRYKHWAAQKGEKAKKARKALTEIRQAKEDILNALEMVKWVDGEGRLRHGHWLTIPRPGVRRARLKEVAVPKERRPKIVEEFLENYRATGSIPEAVAITARHTDYQKSWIYFVTEDVRKRIKEEKKTAV